MASKEEILKLNREKLKSLPIANERLYKETAWITKASPQQVEEIINVVSLFVVRTIKTGGMETVMIPSFGKFKIKPKQVQYLEQATRDETIRSRRK